MKRFLQIILLVPIFGIIYLNYSMYYSPSFAPSLLSKYNKDVYQQVQFLKEEIHQGAASDMQSFFPEGFIFLNALYALTWCNLIDNVEKNAPIYVEGMEEITWTIKAMQSDEGMRIFSKNQLIERGAFYNGWCNYVLGKKLSVLYETSRTAEDVMTFKNKCEQIRNAMQKSESPYLESYIDSAWPADMTLCVASLAIHDKIFEPKYQDDIRNWIQKVKTTLDKETGLIPHIVDVNTVKSIGTARGCSQSLILCFLFEIDKGFAKEQFEIYKNLFVDYRVGLPGIREYPKGIFGLGDIDSGPVIFGIGGAASIVGQRVMGLYGEWELYEGLRNSIEGFGIPYTFGGQKKYLFGVLPMADAFIAWANSIENEPNQTQKTTNWRVSFHLISLLILSILVVFILLLRSRKQ